MQDGQVPTGKLNEDEMITRTLPDELMDEIRALEGAYPVKVGVHELPFTKCDWTTATVVGHASLAIPCRSRSIRLSGKDRVTVRRSSPEEVVVFSLTRHFPVPPLAHQDDLMKWSTRPAKPCILEQKMHNRTNAIRIRTEGANDKNDRTQTMWNHHIM